MAQQSTLFKLESMLVQRSSQLSEQLEAGPLFSYLGKLKVKLFISEILRPQALHSSLVPHQNLHIPENRL